MKKAMNNYDIIIIIKKIDRKILKSNLYIYKIYLHFITNKLLKY